MLLRCSPISLPVFQHRATVRYLYATLSTAKVVNPLIPEFFPIRLERIDMTIEQLSSLVFVEAIAKVALILQPCSDRLQRRSNTFVLSGKVCLLFSEARSITDGYQAINATMQECAGYSGRS